MNPAASMRPSSRVFLKEVSVHVPFTFSLRKVLSAYFFVYFSTKSMIVGLLFSMFLSAAVQFFWLFE